MRTKLRRSRRWNTDLVSNRKYLTSDVVGRQWLSMYLDEHVQEIQEKKQHAVDTHAKVSLGKSRKQEMMASGDYYMEMCHGDRMKKYIRDLYKPNSDEAKLSVE